MERLDTINQRIQERNVATTPPFYFSPRPVPTKYCAFPIIDERIESQEVIHTRMFDIKTNFLPGSNAPGYSQYVDVETKLKISEYKPVMSTIFASTPPKESVQVSPVWNQSTSVRNS